MSDSSASPRPKPPDRMKVIMQMIVRIAKITRRCLRKPAAARKGSYDLVIVESPKKAKTIEAYLGPGFRVKASKGHIRDLPKRKKKGEKVAGVDIDNGWKASYTLLEEGHKNVKEIID